MIQLAPLFRQERTFRVKGSPIIAALGARQSGSQVQDQGAAHGAFKGVYEEA